MAAEKLTTFNRKAPKVGEATIAMGGFGPFQRGEAGIIIEIFPHNKYCSCKRNHLQVRIETLLKESITINLDEMHYFFSRSRFPPGVAPKCSKAQGKQ